MLRRSHDHHRGLRARRHATASANNSNNRQQARYLMTASQSCKSDRRARCLSISNGRVRSDIQPSPQSDRQLTAFNAIRLSFISHFRTHLPRHSNPHSQRRATHVPLPRFPPLEVCVRRPPVPAAPPSWGRHPQTFTKAEVAATLLHVRFVRQDRTSSGTTAKRLSTLAGQPNVRPGTAAIARARP
jgi:hypothetical protein